VYQIPERWIPGSGIHRHRELGTCAIEICARTGTLRELLVELSPILFVTASKGNATMLSVLDEVLHRAVYIAVWNGHWDSAAAGLACVRGTGLQLRDPVTRGSLFPIDAGLAGGQGTKLGPLYATRPLAHEDVDPADSIHLADLAVARFDARLLARLLSARPDGILSQPVALSPRYLALVYRMYLLGPTYVSPAFKKAPPAMSKHQLDHAISGFVGPRRQERSVLQACVPLGSQTALRDSLADANAGQVIIEDVCQRALWLAAMAITGEAAAEGDGDFAGRQVKAGNGQGKNQRSAVASWRQSLLLAIVDTCESVRVCYTAPPASLSAGGSDVCTNLLRLTHQADSPGPLLLAFECRTCARELCAVCMDRCHRGNRACPDCAIVIGEHSESSSGSLSAHASGSSGSAAPGAAGHLESQPVPRVEVEGASPAVGKRTPRLGMVSPLGPAGSSGTSMRPSPGTVQQVSAARIMQHHDIVCIGFKRDFRCGCESGAGTCAALSEWASTARERSGMRYAPRVDSLYELDERYEHVLDIGQLTVAAVNSSPSAPPGAVPGPKGIAGLSAQLTELLARSYHVAWWLRMRFDRFSYSSAPRGAAKQSAELCAWDYLPAEVKALRRAVVRQLLKTLRARGYDLAWSGDGDSQDRMLDLLRQHRSALGQRYSPSDGAFDPESCVLPRADNARLLSMLAAIPHMDDVTAVGAAVLHDLWAAEKATASGGSARYWPDHPDPAIRQMVPFEALTTREQAADRSCAVAVFNVLVFLGATIRLPAGVPSAAPVPISGSTLVARRALGPSGLDHLMLQRAMNPGRAGEVPADQRHEHENGPEVLSVGAAGSTPFARGQLTGIVSAAIALQLSVVVRASLSKLSALLGSPCVHNPFPVGLQQQTDARAAARSLPGFNALSVASPATVAGGIPPRPPGAPALSPPGAANALKGPSRSYTQPVEVGPARESPLLCAIRMGQALITHTLLDLLVSAEGSPPAMILSQTGPRSPTSKHGRLLPLSLAAFGGHIDLCKRMLTLGASPVQPDRAFHALSPIGAMAKARGRKIVNLEEDKIVLMPIHYAALGGHADIVRLFLHRAAELRREGAAVASASAATASRQHDAARRGGMQAKASLANVLQAQARADTIWNRARALLLSIAVHRGHVAVARIVVVGGNLLTPLTADGFGSTPYVRCLLLAQPDAGMDAVAGGAMEKVSSLPREGGPLEASDLEHAMTADSHAGRRKRGRPNMSGIGSDLLSDTASETDDSYDESNARESNHPPDEAGAVGRSSRASRELVWLLSDQAAIKAVLRWFAGGVAATLFLGQIANIVLFIYASSSSPALATLPMGLFKAYVEKTATGSLQGAVVDKCSWHAWLAVNLCVGTGASLCTRSLPLVAGCNLTDVASRLQPPPLLFSTVPLSSSGPASVTGLSLGSAFVVGALKLSYFSHAAVEGEACIPWESSLSSIASGFGPVPALGPCPAFLASARSDSIPSGTDAFTYTLQEGSTGYTASESTLSSDVARTEVDLLASFASSLFGTGGSAAMTTLSSARLEAVLFQPAINVLAAVRLDIMFPPFGTADLSTSVRVVPVKGVPFALSSAASEMGLLVLFLLASFRTWGNTAKKMRWKVIDIIIPILVAIIIGVRAYSYAVFGLSPVWSPLNAVRPGEAFDAWSLLGFTQLDTDLSAVVLLLAILRSIEYLERAPLQVGITLQSIFNSWLHVRTLLYLALLLVLTGAISIPYRAAMSSAGPAFVSFSQSFYSLYLVGFFNTPYYFTTTDSRPITVVLWLLWPITFVVFVNGFIAVLSDVYREVEAKAKRQWRSGVVSQLQDALRWGEQATTKALRRRLWSALVQLPSSCACGWRRSAQWTALDGAGAGVELLLLGVLYVLRPVLLLFELPRMVRTGCCANRKEAFDASVRSPTAGGAAQGAGPPSSLSQRLSMRLRQSVGGSVGAAQGDTRAGLPDLMQGAEQPDGLLELEAVMAFMAACCAPER